MREVPPDEPGLVTHTKAGNVIKHGGSGTAYANYGCRCVACTEANRLRTLRRQRQRVEQTKTGEIPDTVGHGKASTYSNWGCRCGDCTSAWSRKCGSYYTRVLSTDARYKATQEAYEAGRRGDPNPTRK